MIKFYIKVFRTSFPNDVIGLVHVWLVQNFTCIIATPVHDLNFKVTDLEFLCKSFLLKVLQCQFLQSL